jgi:geranylgeranyl diphosphate synthase type I
MHLGLAFQAIDDLLGIWGDPHVTGTPAWSDVRQRKNSLPIAAALCSGAPGAEELRHLLARERLSEADLARAVELIERCQGREQAEAEARTELAAALAALECIPIDPGAHAELAGLARFLGERDY